MKRNISLILVLALTISTFTNISAKDLSDIENHWAKEQINDLVGLGIINGYPDGTFRPDDSIKVIEYIKIVTLALDEEIEVATEGYWGQPFIDKAFELELIFEDQFDNYDRSITREEMAYIITKALEYQISEVTGIENSLIYRIVDNYYIADVYKDTVEKAYGVGLITGYPDGEFKPQQTATRAESAVVIIRLLDMIENGVNIEQDEFIEPENIYTDYLEDGYINFEVWSNNFRDYRDKGYEWKVECLNYPKLNSYITWNASGEEITFIRNQWRSMDNFCFFVGIYSERLELLEIEEGMKLEFNFSIKKNKELRNYYYTVLIRDDMKDE